MPDPSDLARQFRMLRRQREMSQAELARLSGLGRSEINRFECGWAAPTARSLERLARALDARMVLHSGEGDPDSETS
jgi:transcriptional regulator with XRE-family HTH domain